MLSVAAVAEERDVTSNPLRDTSPLGVGLLGEQDIAAAAQLPLPAGVGVVGVSALQEPACEDSIDVKGELFHSAEQGDNNTG